MLLESVELTVASSYVIELDSSVSSSTQETVFFEVLEAVDFDLFGFDLQ